MKADDSDVAMSCATALPVSGYTVETDMTCQAFAQWLTELRSRNSRTLHEMLSEMSIIRDGITSNNMELSEFKRSATNVSQQMQVQLTDLREKLTNAFSEITALVKAKTVSDQEMMQDINSLQQNISVKTQELESLKRSYSQAHSNLQSSLIQIQNNLQVSNGEVAAGRSSCQRVQQDMSSRFSEIDSNVRTLEEDLNVGNAENRNQMLQLQEDIARIHDAIADVTAEFNDHKRATNAVHNKFQSAVWSLEEGKKRMQQTEQMQARMQQQVGSYEPADQQLRLQDGVGPGAAMSPAATVGAVPAGARHAAPYGQASYAGMGSAHFRPGSGTLPQMVPSMTPGPMPTRSQVVLTAPTAVNPIGSPIAAAPVLYHRPQGPPAQQVR